MLIVSIIGDFGHQGESNHQTCILGLSLNKQARLQYDKPKRAYLKA